MNARRQAITFVYLVEPERSKTGPAGTSLLSLPSKPRQRYDRSSKLMNSAIDKLSVRWNRVKPGKIMKKRSSHDPSTMRIYTETLCTP